MIGLIVTLLVTLVGIGITISIQLDKLNKMLDELGRQINDDAQKELERIGDQMMSTYELPPLDLIG